MDGVDRPAWEAFVFGKEELEDFLVGISTVGKQSDNARDEFVRCALFGKECFRNFLMPLSTTQISLCAPIWSKTRVTGWPMRSA